MRSLVTLSHDKKLREDLVAACMLGLLGFLARRGVARTPPRPRPTGGAHTRACPTMAGPPCLVGERHAACLPNGASVHASFCNTTHFTLLYSERRAQRLVVVGTPRARRVFRADKKASFVKKATFIKNLNSVQETKLKFSERTRSPLRRSRYLEYLQAACCCRSAAQTPNAVEITNLFPYLRFV